MKIHIDTSSPKEKAQADVVKNKDTAAAKTKKPSSSQSKSSGASASSPQSAQNQALSQTQSGLAPGENINKGAMGKLAKSPPKEPKPPSDVLDARARQTAALKQRQTREVQGKNFGARDTIDTGAGFWPPLTPFL